MKYSNFLFFTICFLLSNHLNAQFNNSMDTRMRDFINTPFMEQYQKIQLKMVRQVRTFMVEQNNYTPAEVQKVKEAYTTTSKAFNDILLEIKKDFLDRKIRKIIKDAPDLYHSKLEMSMGALKDTYATDFLQTLSDVKGEQIDGGLGFLLILTEWTKFTFYVVDFFTEKKWKNAMFNDAFLRDRLIKPYSFPSWNTILMQNTPGMMNGGYEGMGPDMMMSDGMSGEVNPNMMGMPPGGGY